MVDNLPLSPDRLGPRLAEVYAVLGPLYRRVARLVEHDSPRNGLSIGVRAVLERLEMTGTAETVPQIARALELSRQFVQRMVNDALAQDFVALEPNPAHRRSPLVALTDAGRAAINAVQRREHEAMGRVGGDLTDAEIDTTLRVLRHMLAAVRDTEERSP
ncbi:MarR family winged helix-turn-helix transcriptional regulator [Saccharopolyspora hordei]|uniref:DNA-binding MarR family transcriptional regulator n=1 Tax=Saccharopolyspora hordei TaxID=1838 RepID=A0A853AL33_9PSEU|nr:MarR family transcriptional regulator [Saccharopolyspora hordei]NYI83759.1 DNA-binding MarR family transcriptional regulator [Saccharopolyspora hordei]